MNHATHNIDKYESDYRVWVEYCSACGKEGDKLESPCSFHWSEVKIDPRVDKAKKAI